MAESGLLSRPLWPRSQVRNRSRPQERIDQRSLHALGILMLMVQLPHLSRLPWWVSLAAGLIVAGRLYLVRHSHAPLRHFYQPLITTPMALIFAAVVYLQFGYLLGRDPGVAFLVLLSALKFAEHRKNADATLLLCLSAFLLLTQYFSSQSLMAALLTLPAVFALGHAMAVLRDPEHARPSRELLGLIGRMLAQGVPVAVLLFVLFPRLPGPLWNMPSDATAATGLSSEMAPGSIGSLSKSDAVAFRVRFEGAEPAPHQRYWRGPVMEAFDGRRWQAIEPTPQRVIRYTERMREHEPATLSAALPAAGVSRYEVALVPHQRHWLFTLEQNASLPRLRNTDSRGRAQVFLSETHEIFSRKPISRITHYEAWSRLGDRLHPLDEPDARALALPGKNPRAQAHAQQLKQRHPEPGAFAQAVLKGFSVAPFRYTLQPGLLGDAPVDEFLFDTRAGYCEHYASAFVVLMRAAGIPARVVTGYLGGEMNGDYMIVRQSDAHAWAEAWIDGAWQRFDPTAAIAPDRVERGMAAALGDSEPVPGRARQRFPMLNRVQMRWDALNYAWQQRIVNFDNRGQKRLFERIGLPDLPLWQLAAIVAGIVGLWSALMLLRLPDWRARRRLDAAEREWRQLLHRLSREGHVRQNDEAPMAFIERVAAQLPETDATRLREHGARLTRLRFAMPA